jgi:RNA polymerase sigma-70 factor (ECF subfamily)
VQEAFLECLRQDGVLQSADPQRPGGFRAYLFGLLRNVALRVEQRRVRDGRLTLQQAETLDGLADGADSATAVFDREWAGALMREAALRQAAHAGAKDAAAQRRVELLRLRFHEQLPIRDIAKQWAVDADVLHREYAKARREFEAALRAVVVEHHPGDEAGIERTLREIVRALGR